jgi:hypothetical protein
MNGPKFESDNRGGIKFCDEGGAKLEFNGIAWIAKIPHGKKSFNSDSCRLSFPKRFPKVVPVNRNLPVKFCADKNHSGDPAVSSNGANESLRVIIN